MPLLPVSSSLFGGKNGRGGGIALNSHVAFSAMRKRKDQRNAGNILRTHILRHMMETIIFVILMLNIVISTSPRIRVVYHFDTDSLAGIGIDIPYAGTGRLVFWSVF